MKKLFRVTAKKNFLFKTVWLLMFSSIFVYFLLLPTRITSNHVVINTNSYIINGQLSAASANQSSGAHDFQSNNFQNYKPNSHWLQSDAKKVFAPLLWHFLSPHLNGSNEPTTPDPDPNFKYILLWNRLPGAMTRLLGNGHDKLVRHGCQFSQCHVVDRTSKKNQRHKMKSMDLYDAVVFNMNVLRNSLQLPWTMKKYKRNLMKQKFVFFNQEPPGVYTWGKEEGKEMNQVVKQFENYFNWSMTYRHDADVHFFYGSVRPKLSTNSSSLNHFSNEMKNGSSIVAWMVSHCQTESRREDYVNELKRHMNVDVYGDCGEMEEECSKDPVTFVSPDECYRMIESKYKFYLSFENALCTDYVTEKFFDILNYKIVPVVYGGANYSRIAPPHSFIDARQFEPKQLADYLMKLDADDALYKEYFAWKDHYDVGTGVKNQVLNGFCDLCRQLHQDNNRPQIFSQLMNHWLPENQCTVLKLYK